MAPVATPIIDSTKLEGHLALMLDIDRESRKIAGYSVSMTLP
jgi:hypothetical protein